MHIPFRFFSVNNLIAWKERPRCLYFKTKRSLSSLLLLLSLPSCLLLLVSCSSEIPEICKYFGMNKTSSPFILKKFNAKLGLDVCFLKCLTWDVRPSIFTSVGIQRWISTEMTGIFSFCTCCKRAALACGSIMMYFLSLKDAHHTSISSAQFVGGSTPLWCLSTPKFSLTGLVKNNQKYIYHKSSTFHLSPSFTLFSPDCRFLAFMAHVSVPYVSML